MQAEVPEITPLPARTRSSPPLPQPSTSAQAMATYEVAFHAAAEPSHDQGISESSAAREVTLVVCGERNDSGRCLVRLCGGDRGTPGGAAAVHRFEAPDVGRMASVWVGHVERGVLQQVPNHAKDHCYMATTPSWSRFLSTLSTSALVYTYNCLARARVLLQHLSCRAVF